MHSVSKASREFARPSLNKTHTLSLNEIKRDECAAYNANKKFRTHVSVIENSCTHFSTKVSYENMCSVYVVNTTRRGEK